MMKMNTFGKIAAGTMIVVSSIALQPLAGDIIKSISGGRGSGQFSLFAQSKNPYEKYLKNKPGGTTPAPAKSDSTPARKPAESADVEALKAKVQKQADDYYKTVKAEIDDAAKYNDSLFAAKKAIIDSLMNSGTMSKEMKGALAELKQGKISDKSRKAIEDYLKDPNNPELFKDAISAVFDEKWRKTAGSPIDEGAGK